MVAGQKVKINSVILRMTEVQHDINDSSATTTVTATDDLLNSFPVSITDQYSLVMENLLVNSKESKDIRAGSDIDSLISILTKDYPS
jgi:hypothetical protein